MSNESSVMVSLRMPGDVKRKLDEKAMRTGITKSKLLCDSFESMSGMGKVLDAVREHLAACPPPLIESYEPSDSECLVFIARAVAKEIGIQEQRGC